MKIDRLMSIIIILLDKKRVSAKSLAEQFEVSLRTIYRDIDAIDLAGIPIRAISGVGGGFEIMPNYKLDQQVFSTADLSTILTGLSSLSALNYGDELLHAMTKVKSFVPIDRAKEIDLKLNQVSIDLTPWMNHKTIQPNLEIIKSAIQTNRVLSFSYVNRDGSYTKREAEPYQLVLKGNNWYWHGYCLNKQDFRLFKVNRTHDLSITNNSFIYREHEQPLLTFDTLLETIQTTIKIRIHRSITREILDYCDYNSFIPDGNDHYIVLFPFIENDYYFNILLGFGNKCECLFPLHIRKELKHRIDIMANLYKN